VSVREVPGARGRHSPSRGRRGMGFADFRLAVLPALFVTRLE
jgi:hypothetical protein